ncbi:TPA: hypothetical protein DDW35_14085 [Candidatus Sumerlaeota bacterium]|jgi:hypothetical protein|nr:hypothetical protein [Candidatus Sumerlaeota bacterium]
MSIFEIIMLLCFGISWPFSLYKTWKAKNSTSKSRVFLVLVILGYVSGVLHKVYHSPDWVILLYVLNGAMVFADFYLCCRYRDLARAPV